MAKADFVFYKFPQLPGEFVLPAEASDPYKSLVEPQKAGELALGPLVKVVEDVIGSAPDVSIKRASKSETNSYFFNTVIPPGVKVIRQKASIAFELPHEPTGGYRSPAMGKILTAINRMDFIVPLMDESAISQAGVKDPLSVRREQNALIGTERYDLEMKPVHVRLLDPLRQLVPIRGFRWLPGSMRATHDGQPLPPNYSPRPVPVAFAQTIDLVGLNPAAQN